jgi:hypothetical protein
MIKPRLKAFTLIEVIVSLACALLMAGPLLKALMSTNQSATVGMKKMETALTADRILRTIHQDLQGSVFIRPKNLTSFHPSELRLITRKNAAEKGFAATSTLTISGQFPTTAYSFLTFPRGTSALQPLLSRVEYRMDSGKDPVKGIFQLVRTEKLPASHPDFSKFPQGIREKVLSAQVAYFSIEAYNPPDCPGLEMFWVNLRLVERPEVANSGIADYYNVAGSDFFLSQKTVLGYRPTNRLDYFIEP